MFEIAMAGYVRITGPHYKCIIVRQVHPPSAIKIRLRMTVTRFKLQKTTLKVKGRFHPLWWDHPPGPIG